MTTDPCRTLEGRNVRSRITNAHDEREKESERRKDRREREGRREER